MKSFIKEIQINVIDSAILTSLTMPPEGVS